MIVDNALFFASVEEQLADGVRVRIRLRGNSMEPALRDGEEIELAPMEEDPKVGDVVLFRSNGRHLLHRVVAAEGDCYTLQGDHCYGKERCGRADMVARLVMVPRVGPVEEEGWQRVSCRSLRRKRMRNCAIRALGRQGRRRLRPWYFALLAFFMWAPLGGLGIPLDNYIFGLRADHLLHASLFLPCALLLSDLVQRHWLLWLVCIGVGLLTEGVQWLLPWRGFDVSDLVANAAGVTLGWLVLIAVRRGARRRR